MTEVLILFSVIAAIAVLSLILDAVKAVKSTMADIRAILSILKSLRNGGSAGEDTQREPTVDELCRDFRIQLERAQMNRRR